MMTVVAHQFVVTRQRQWPSGELCVEISQGGIDFTNPDALGAEFDGEMEVIEGMVNAVKAGIAIYIAWKAECPDEEIGIAIGCTYGDTMPFSGEELTDEVIAQLMAKATEFDESLPKCDKCGEVLGKDRYSNEDYCADEAFCSQYCCEESVRFQIQLMDEESPQDEED